MEISVGINHSRESCCASAGVNKVFGEGKKYNDDDRKLFFRKRHGEESLYFFCMYFLLFCKHYDNIVVCDVAALRKAYLRKYMSVYCAGEEMRGDLRNILLMMVMRKVNKSKRNCPVSKLHR